MTHLSGLALLGVFAVVSSVTSLHAAPTPPVQRDIEYARAGEHRLLLDLYLPAVAVRDAPLIVWVHGGAWRAGSKQDMPLGALVEKGFAIASVDYRLSTMAPFPAQAHDIKAAIRFLGQSRKTWAATPGGSLSPAILPADIWQRWWGSPMATRRWKAISVIAGISHPMFRESSASSACRISPPSWPSRRRLA